MLYKETVDQATLDLLIRLQSKKYLKGFHLVGGTAIAFRIGHRKSIDLDLFSDFGFDVAYLLENLSSDFSFNLYFSATNTIRGSIDKVEVDILSHRYPMINKPVFTEQISMLSLEDIVAMKLNAITTSGQRVKDFIDIYYLLRKFSLAKMIGFYKTKYTQYNEINVLKSIVYFDDVDTTDWPRLIEYPSLNWEEVKKEIENATRDYLKDL